MHSAVCQCITIKLGRGQSTKNMVIALNLFARYYLINHKIICTYIVQYATDFDGIYNRVIQEEGLYVYNMHNIVEKDFSMTIAPVRSRGGSLVLIIKSFTCVYTYHSRFIPERLAEVSQIFLRDSHVLPKLVSYEEHCRLDRWCRPIAVLLQAISGVSAINPLVAFYDIQGGKIEVLFFYFVLDTTRD
jgi:hypothetical protein